MSDEHHYCARGCMRPCRQDQCIADPENCEHDTRIRATVGLLCDRCSERLLEAVDDLPDLWAQMPGLYDTSHGIEYGDKISRGGRTGSPSLIRLDVMVLQANAFDRPGSTAAYEGDGVMPVWPTLNGWLAIIEDELGLTPAGDTMSQAATMLHTWHQRICAQPWIDEYWTDLTSIRRSLRRTTGAPGPIARCWGRIANRDDCGRLLYPPPPGNDTITCRHCGRTYTGAEIIKLSIQGEREGIA